jgi:hypothetical protein
MVKKRQRTGGLERLVDVKELTAKAALTAISGTLALYVTQGKDVPVEVASKLLETAREVLQSKGTLRDDLAKVSALMRELSRKARSRGATGYRDG